MTRREVEFHIERLLRSYGQSALFASQDWAEAIGEVDLRVLAQAVEEQMQSNDLGCPAELRARCERIASTIRYEPDVGGCSHNCSRGTITVYHPDAQWRAAKYVWEGGSDHRQLIAVTMAVACPCEQGQHFRTVRRQGKAVDYGSYNPIRHLRVRETVIPGTNIVTYGTRDKHQRDLFAWAQEFCAWLRSERNLTESTDWTDAGIPAMDEY